MKLKLQLILHCKNLKIFEHEVLNSQSINENSEGILKQWKDLKTNTFL